jgi:SAM-dependent methyltransferase
MLTEWFENAGSVGPYFHQDQIVASWIHALKPERHVDVGSRIDGFIGNVSSFRSVEVIDIRPQPSPIRNVIFHQIDLMAELPASWIDCTDSLSCLHTIEHFGLGRYGDDIDPDGHLKGLDQLKKMVKPGGRLYLSTPIGPQRVEFNAHRVTAASTLVDWFSDGWEIERMAVIDDNDQLHEPIDWKVQELGAHFGCHLGVGIIVARKMNPLARTVVKSP